MNIKLVETLTGMTRSNIRFYENEGFITPTRLSNGYREYSDEDVEILKRIKLLRSLHLPLDDIKNLHNGTNDLLEILNQHIENLEKEITELNQSSKLCKKILDDQVTYSTLHADDYFNNTDPIIEINEDIVKQPIIPWRRYFARIFDLGLYGLLWSFVLVFVFKVSLTNRNTLETLLDSYMSIAFMFLFEPILLSKFATTPGKWSMGIYVYDYSNYKLTWMESVNRTFKVFVYGMGCTIPLLGMFREFISCHKYTNNKTLEWDVNTTIKAKEKYGFGIFVYISIFIIRLLLVAMIYMLSLAPNHKGDLTISQFADNYNYVAKLRSENELSCYLDINANWAHVGNVIHTSPVDHPNIQFELENGVIKKITIEQALYSNTNMILNHPNPLIYTLEAMVTAQKGYNPLSNNLSNLESDFIDHIGSEYKKDYLNLSIYYHLDYKGYQSFDYDVWLPDETDPHNHFIYKFEIIVNEK